MGSAQDSGCRRTIATVAKVGLRMYVALAVRACTLSDVLPKPRKTELSGWQPQAYQ